MRLLSNTLLALCASWAVAAGSNASTQAATSLRSTFHHDNITSFFQGQPGYANASRPYNLRLPFQPIAVAYPNNTKEVAEAVVAAASQGIFVSARSGGHSYAAFGLGGANGHLVIDLSNFKDVTVDNKTGAAVIGAGNRLGDVATALFAQGGRALPHGTCPLVGLGGHASYGGYGFTSRQWGLTLDNVVAATVVLANGTITNASSTQHPDLFWALRGAAPSFGIITHFHFQTFPAPTAPTFFDYRWSLPLDQAIKAISLYQNFSFSPNIPKEIGFEMNLAVGNNKGEIQLNFLGSYYGNPQNFQAIVEPYLQEMPTPIPQVNVTDWLGNLELLAGGALASAGNSGATDSDTFYAKSLTTPMNQPMSHKAITALATWMSVQGWQTNTSWFVQLELYGGKTSKINQVPTDATSYEHRSDLWTIQFYTSSKGNQPPFPSQDGFSFLDGMVNSIISNEPSTWQFGAYPNYVDPRLTTSQWHALYYGPHYARLSQIKAQVDPHGVFTFPQSISPAQ